MAPQGPDGAGTVPLEHDMSGVLLEVDPLGAYLRCPLPDVLPRPPFVVIDTETTGLPHAPEARVIELGAVLVLRDGSIMAGGFSSLVQWRPGRGGLTDHERKALDVSGISLAELAEAPSPDDVWRAFCDWSRVLPPDYTVTAYNLPFDRTMVERTWEGIATGWPVWSDRCLLSAAKACHRPKTGRLRLETLAARYGLLEAEGLARQTHRALDDARVAARLWRLLWDRR